MEFTVSGILTRAQGLRVRKPYATAFWLVAAGIAAAMLVMHLVAGLTLPVPWGDEAFFVWQARAFERFNHFAAPELDATRPILLLPFLYQALLGVAFKLFGFSLGLARDISLLFTLAGFGFLATTVRKGSAPIAALVVIGAFLMGAEFIALGNNARMEAMLFLFICAALFLLQTGRIWLAVAVLAITPMVHPNGMLYLVPTAVHAVMNLKVHRTRPERAALITFGLALIAWIANGVYALSFWQGFMHDLAYRLSETSTANSGWEQYGGWHGLGLVLIILTGLVGRWRNVRIGHFITIALGSWLHSRLRIETWYEVFGGLAYLMLTLALIEIVMHEAPKVTENRFKALRPGAIAAGLAITLIGIQVLGGRVPGPRNYVSDLSLDGMTTSRDSVAYFTNEDRTAIESYVLARKAEGAHTFEIYPWGDSLLFGELADKGVAIQIPYFDPTFSAGAKTWAWGYGPTEWPTADVYIIRNSRYQPRWLDERFERVIRRAEQRTDATVQRIHSRNSTEIWYAVVRKK